MYAFLYAFLLLILSVRSGFQKPVFLLKQFFVTERRIQGCQYLVGVSYQTIYNGQDKRSESFDIPRDFGRGKWIQQFDASVGVVTSYTGNISIYCFVFLKTLL